MTGLVVTLQLAATWYMTGLAWLVQVVHYPLLARVGADGYRRYHAEHMERTTWVVAPVMLVELATAFAYLWLRPAEVPYDAAVAGLLLLAAVWASTFLLQVPAHRRLSAGFDPDVHRRLVATSWIRTLAWTARGVLLCLALG